MIKLLTGEVIPQEGTVWKHPNARVAYVAQHAFHHIEQHLEKTPNEYIRWRFQHGDDKEALAKDTMQLTDEEREKVKEPCTFEIEGRQGQQEQGEVAHREAHRRQEDGEEGDRVRGSVRGHDLQLEQVRLRHQARQVGFHQAHARGRREGCAARAAPLPPRSPPPTWRSTSRTSASTRSSARTRACPPSPVARR